MFKSVTTEDWELLVSQQLKTDDLYAALSKENLEGVSIKPYYGSEKRGSTTLPKVEESTQLVSAYSDYADENVYAFLLNEEVHGLEGKKVFVNTRPLAKRIIIEQENDYFSLVDVFSENTGDIDDSLVNLLLQKNFKKNICIDIALHQNAGAAIYQQLGIALAKAKELAERFGKDVVKTLVFRIAVGSNYFFEISKIRALKLLFNQLSQEYGFNEIPYIFAETTLRNKAKNDEENNLIRSTVEVAAAMVGGADAVFVHDFKLYNATSLSQEIAFKQQVVLAYESIINVFEDAASGSYFAEDLTLQFAQKSWNYFIETEDGGGYLALLKVGKVQKDIYTHAVAEQRWIEEGKIKLTGVNLYPKRPQSRSAEQLYSKTHLKPVRWAEMFE